MPTGMFPLIIIGGLIAFVLFTPGLAEAEVLGLWAINETTVVLDDPNNNVNIGENETTEFKLHVAGEANIHDTLTIEEGHLRIENKDEQIVLDANGVTETTLDDGDPVDNITITLPTTTTKLAGLSTANSFSGINEFTNTWTDYSYAQRHLGDGNTYNYWTEDAYYIRCGNVQMMHFSEKVSQDEVIINTGLGTDVDFVFKTSSTSDAFVLDEGKEIVNINMDTTTTKDLIFEGVSSGLSYASMYMHEVEQEIVITGVNDYTQIIGWTEGLMNNVENTSNAFEFEEVGVYKVDWQISGDADGNNKDFECDIFFGSNEENDGSAKRNFAAAGSLGSFSGTALINVDSTRDTLSIRLKNTTDGTNFVIYNANINVVQVGGISAV